MKAVIVHYHLNPGGVTRIIGSQIAGIRRGSEDMPVTLLCGSNPGLVNFQGADIITNSVLDYWDASWPDFRERVEAITKILKHHLTDHAVLHCHNPNLGKNPALTLAVYQLAEEGYPVVNHCHDFPEDRPANMEILNNFLTRSTGKSLPEILYPGFPRYHFVILNSCDYKRILRSGIPDSRTHLLPNPVSLHTQINPSGDPTLKRRICNVLGFSTSRKVCTYPVRAIERKNLGEFILLAVLFSGEAQFTVTQPPMNPIELPGYDRWKIFCRGNAIPVKFESGKEVNHEELINISDFCISTSIREGFGMVFLEPWLAGTPVIGRDIPCVTADLKGQGIEFTRLYSGIIIAHAGRMTDFKDLAFEQQEQVITRIARQKSARLKLLNDNPFLANILDDFPPDIIRRNQRIIQDEFSLEKYGKRLLEIYREVSQ
ncbi:MAG: glycosyltransferase family 4 protein [Bacteroidales bacterium]|nr:glycosyltransferase family 4 protein [Bacteroidales bacterium]